MYSKNKMKIFLVVMQFGNDKKICDDLVQNGWRKG